MQNRKQSKNSIINEDPCLVKLRELWAEAIGEEPDIELASKVMRLFCQFTRQPEGVPLQHQPEAKKMLDFLVKALPSMNLDDAQSAIPAIKYARRQLRSVPEHGSAFRRKLSASDRKTVARIGKPVRLSIVPGAEPATIDIDSVNFDIGSNLLDTYKP